MSNPKNKKFHKRAYEIKETYLKGMPNQKSLLNNYLAAAIRKIRRHIISKKLAHPHGLSNKECVRIFCIEYNIEYPKTDYRVWLVDMWLSERNEILKRSTDHFYNTPKWKQFRKETLAYYGNTCMKCGSESKSNCVDHIKPRSIYPELEYEFTNMQILCTLCNLLKSNRHETDYRIDYSQFDLKE